MCPVASYCYPYYLPPSHERGTHSSELPTRTHAHSFFSSPAETAITPSLHTKKPISKHPIDDRYLRRRGIILSNPQWHLPQEKTGPPPQTAHCPRTSYYAPHSAISHV